MYYFYGIIWEFRDEKFLGVFKYKVNDLNNELLRGFDFFFYVLYFCYGYINILLYNSVDGFSVVVEFDDVGVYIVVLEDKCMVFVMGYLEYDLDIFKDEYFWDIVVG